MLAFLALLPRVLVTFFYALAALLRFFVDGTVEMVEETAWLREENARCDAWMKTLNTAERLRKSCSTQGRLKVRHKAAGAGMLVPVLLGLLSSLGPAFCQY